MKLLSSIAVEYEKVMAFHKYNTRESCNDRAQPLLFLALNINE